MWRISWLSEELFASQDGICSMQFVSMALHNWLGAERRREGEGYIVIVIVIVIYHG
jgi:hypothetical protein